MKTFQEFLEGKGDFAKDILKDTPFNTDKDKNAPGAAGSRDEKGRKEKFEGKKTKSKES